MRGRSSVTAIPLVFLLLVVSGCASPKAAAPDLDAPDGPFTDLPPLPPLPCEPDRSGQGLSPSLTVLAFETFAGDGAVREEIDTAVIDGRTLLAVSQPSGDALEFLDVTDPRAPAPVASWYGDGDLLDDFKFLPDGTGIVTVGRSLRILDIREMEDVQVESSLDLAGDKLGDGYGHTVAAWVMQGRTYVSIGKAEAGDVSIFALEGEPGGRTLARTAHVGATPISALPGRPDPLRSHDTWFEVDPVLGTPLLWVANVNWGILAYDVTDPSAPVVAATMLPGADNPLTGYMHTAQVTHFDGRRLVVGAQEYEAGVLKVWDASDLRAPRLIGTWHTPVATMPFHNMQVVGQYVFATHFHEGLYVFDLAELPTPAAPGPAATMQLFAHIPAEGNTEGARVPIGPVQSYEGTYEVVVQGGILWTTEVGAGIRSFAFGCMKPGDPSATSTG
ncbi:MAG TPA: hypothetical protein VM327_10495 [Candidatus Thermoplasmatota archaeon]|nr:hypothetical protein [Candidatus Thermoplasmatota archaeon]